MNQDQFEQIINPIMHTQEKDYQAFKLRLKEHASTGKKLLLEIDVPSLKREKPEKYFRFLINLCHRTALFPDKDVIRKLKALGISSKVTRWFIPLEKIENCFKEINKKKILILKNIALGNILLFLKSKIREELLKQSQKLLKMKADPGTKLKQATINTLRRREYGSPKPHETKNQLDKIIYEIAGLVEKGTDSKKAAKLTHIKLITGKSETIYLKGLLRSFVPTKKMEQTSYLASISGIFKLLSKDRVILSKAKYEEPESFYENNYNRYLAIRVKNISSYDPKTDDFRDILIHP